MSANDSLLTDVAAFEVSNPATKVVLPTLAPVDSGRLFGLVRGAQRRMSEIQEVVEG